MHILVVEDERKIADAVREGLEAEQYDVAVERNGVDAVERISRDAFDLVLLDLGLPGCDGFQVLKAIRARAIPTRVLVLTAADAVQDRVSGLDAGADDYLAKPFAFAELMARVRALLRRASSSDLVQITVGDLSLDRATHTVERRGERLELTPKEFDLLEYLMRHHDHVVSREALARDVWHEAARSIWLDNVIDVHMSRLRRKIDADHLTRLIHTVRGVGFIVGVGDP